MKGQVFGVHPDDSMETNRFQPIGKRHLITLMVIYRVRSRYLAFGGTSMKRLTFVSKRFIFEELISHCQIVRTFQPNAFNSFKTVLSLAILPEIFFLQNGRFVEGSFERLHSLCPCQKHPLTKMTFFNFRITISGFPGSVLLNEV